MFSCLPGKQSKDEKTAFIENVGLYPKTGFPGSF